MVIAQKVELPKLFVFGRQDWSPEPAELEIIGTLIDSYNDFCTHAKQNYDRAWVNKDSGHAIFDVKFNERVGDVKYELTASIIVDFHSPDDRLNGQFLFSRLTKPNHVWLYDKSLYASSLQVGTSLRVEDTWLKQNA